MDQLENRQVMHDDSKIKLNYPRYYKTMFQITRKALQTTGNAGRLYARPNAIILGLFHERLDHKKKALACYKKISVKSPSVHYRMGSLLLSLGDHEKAAKHLKQASARRQARRRWPAR